jgi:hypothetical protein
LIEPLLILRVAAAAPGQQIVEGKAGQRPQVAVALKAGEAFLLEFLFCTLAGHYFAKVRMSEGYVKAQPALPLAKRAIIFISFLDIATS